MNYCIVNSRARNTKPLLFWKNSVGWVSYTLCDVFSDLEQCTLPLPHEGDWVPYTVMDTLFYALPEKVRKGLFDL